MKKNCMFRTFCWCWKGCKRDYIRFRFKNMFKKIYESWRNKNSTNKWKYLNSQECSKILVEELVLIIIFKLHNCWDGNKISSNSEGSNTVTNYEISKSYLSKDNNYTNIKELRLLLLLIQSILKIQNEIIFIFRFYSSRYNWIWSK